MDKRHYYSKENLNKPWSIENQLNTQALPNPWAPRTSQSNQASSTPSGGGNMSSTNMGGMNPFAGRWMDMISMLLFL